MDSCVTAHHWIIDAQPKYGSYHATCKNCGEEREFPAGVNRFRFRVSKDSNTQPAVEPLSGSPPETGQEASSADAKNS